MDQMQPEDRTPPPEASAYAPPRAMSERSWFGRNWFWVVPLAVLVPFCACGILCGGILFGTFATLKSSTPYRMAVDEVRQSDEVREMVGQPMEMSYFPSGNIHVEGSGAGEANFDFTVSGPDGTAHVHAEAVREAGEWRIERLEVTPAGNADGKVTLVPRNAN